MKTLIILLATVTLCACSVISDIPGDNSHYVEGESRYIWMPDGDGVPHLVDLEEKEDVPMTRNAGARNEYWLFTRNNRNNRQILRHNDINSVRNSHYRNNRQTKIIVHGWNSNGNSAVNTHITSAYLDVVDVNVIVVDWRNSASGLYNTSVRDVPNVGEHLGRFLQWLLNTFGGNWNNFHLIGFSLGAHIVGNAGRTIGGRAIRVTGLDPAGPQWGGNSRALNNRDGVYVEAIHTDGGLLGIFDPIADADFYPNGGRNAQPGCWVSTCSHSRAYELFAASVRYNHFIGRRCANLNEARNNRCAGAQLRMGNRDLGKRGAGLFGLTTGNRWPF